eukprot:1154809-Prymnesium_polylepis.1
MSTCETMGARLMQRSSTGGSTLVAGGGSAAPGASGLYCRGTPAMRRTVGGGRGRERPPRTIFSGGALTISHNSSEVTDSE